VVDKLFSRLIGFLRRNDRGQDLAEYCLITAVIALIGLGLFINVSGGLQNLWGAANSTIAAGSPSPIQSAGASTGAAMPDAPADQGDHDHGGDGRQ
jgi:Flp pilus assembly pilin Flp